MKKLLLFASSLAISFGSMSQVVFSVESPASLQGSKDLEYAPAGGDWSNITDLLDPDNAVTASLVQAVDGTTADSLACEDIVNTEDFAKGEVNEVSVYLAGSGYSDATDVAVTGGSGTGLTLDIAVSAGGALLAFETNFINAGAGYSDATGVATTTAGSGSGLTVDITAGTQGIVSMLDNASLSGGTEFTDASDVATTTDGAGTGLTVDYTVSADDNVASIDDATFTPGTGYVDATDVATTGGSGTGLTLDITASPIDAADAVTVTTPGTGYVDATDLATTGGSGSGLLVSFTTAAGAVNNVVISNGGSGYTLSDVVTIVGGNDDATLTITSVDAGGEILTVAVNNAGEGYTVSDVINISGGNDDATTTVTAVNAGGVITSVTINEGGEGYEVGDLITIESATGTDATIEVSEITGGEIATIEINEAGTGYAVGDVIEIDGGSETASIEVAEVSEGGEILTATINSVGTNYVTGDTVDVVGGDENARIIIEDAQIGKIAILWRGDCEFGRKALNAENAGAIAVVIINQEPGGPVPMGAGADGANVTIPTVMISDVDGAAILAAMNSGEDVVAFIGNKTGFYPNDIGMYPGSATRAQAFGIHSLLAQSDADFEVEMGAMVYNFGFNDQTGVTLNATITFDGNEIYNETVDTPIDIAAQDSAFIELPIFSQSEYETGYYEVTYTIDSDSVDVYDFDNEISADFAINDEIFSYSSLDPDDLTLTHPGGTRANADIFEACIVFRDPNASRVIATGMEFSAVMSADAEYGLDGIPVNYSIRRWENVFTDLDDPNLALDGLVEIEGGEFFFEGDPQEEIVSIDFDESVVFEDNQRYMFCLSTFEQELFFGYDRGVDYDYNVSTKFKQPLFPITIDSEQTFLLGFGNDAVPAFGLKLIDAAFLNTQEEQLNINMKAYPSPANSQVTVDFQGHDVTSVEVLSLAGQRVAAQAVAAGVGHTVVDVNGLENGMYIFKVYLANGLSKTMNVVVAH